jgi:hypothetical protein
MRNGRLALILLATPLSPTACNQNPRQKIRREELPAVFVVAPAATAIDSRRYGQAFGVSYEAPVAYPAAALIAQIQSSAKDAGWHALPEDWLNPGIPSSVVRGWTDYLDKSHTPTTFVHQWQAQWSNSAGDILTYALWYTSPGSPPYPLPTPNHASLRVAAELIPRVFAEQMRAAAASQPKH